MNTLKKIKLVSVIFLVAFLFRLSLLFVAHHGDLNNNITWGTLAVERGLSGFYEGEDWPYSAPNQPPLTILTFAGARAIWQGIEDASWWLNDRMPIFPSPFIWFWEGKGMDLLVKLPSVLADLAIGWVIYDYFRKKRKKSLGLKVTTVWLFNPVIWYNSSVWGQTDSVVNLLGLLAVLFLLKKDFVKFSVFVAFSILFKGSLVIFIPILLGIAIWQGYTAKDWIRAGFAGLATTIAISIWFHPSIDLISWLFNLYKTRIMEGEIGYLTANAFNFWWLVNPGEIYDSAVYFGLTARTWGLMAIVGSVLIIINWLRRKISDKRMFVALFMTTFLSFLLLTRVHERYLYPLFPYATILLGLIPGILFPYVALSLVHLLNLYHLFWAPSLAPLEALYLNPTFPQVLSIVNIGVFFYLLRLFRRSKI